MADDGYGNPATEGRIVALEMSDFYVVSVYTPNTKDDLSRLTLRHKQWEWMEELIRKKGSPINVLNLFGYTGGATLACAKAGAQVTHIDASKTAVAWAKENAALSGLADKPIRWITEDVLVFVQREIKRGNRYDAIVMDPPAFGHGPKDELWKIEERLVELITLCEELLTEKPLFFLINGYAAGYSPLAFVYNLEPLVKKYGGTLEYGDLAIAEQGSEGSVLGENRLLPCGIFARWAAAH